jgi:hypothetical protein
MRSSRAASSPGRSSPRSVPADARAARVAQLERDRAAASHAAALRGDARQRQDRRRSACRAPVRGERLPVRRGADRDAPTALLQFSRWPRLSTCVAWLAAGSRTEKRAAIGRWRMEPRRSRSAPTRYTGRVSSRASPSPSSTNNSAGVHQRLALRTGARQARAPRRTSS